MTPLRAFFRHFREAIARASISVGPVQVCLDVQRDRLEPRLRDGYIAVSRLTRAPDVLTCENERTKRGG